MTTKKNPLRAKKILQTEFPSVNTTGMYEEACKEWRQKGDSGKTWTNFKRHFVAEYHKIREQHRVLGKAGFNRSQIAHETTDMATALDNLELAATAKRNIFSYLIAINKEFVDTNNVIVAQVKSLAATNTRLANTQGTGYQKPPRATITRESVPIDPNRYCWYHGLKVRMGHRSIIYGGKLQGHHDNTTRTNTINGKIWNKLND